MTKKLTLIEYDAVMQAIDEYENILHMETLQGIEHWGEPEYSNAILLDALKTAKNTIIDLHNPF